LHRTRRNAVAVIALVALALGFCGTANAGEGKAAKRDQLSFEGTVSAVDLKAGTVTVKKKDGSMTFQVPAECKIFVERVKTSAKLSHLKVGDKVELYYVAEDGDLVAQRIAERGAQADHKEKREDKGR